MVSLCEASVCCCGGGDGDGLSVVPVRAGLHVTLLQLGLGFDVLWETLTVLIRQHFISADVHTVGRVQLVAWHSQRGIGS